MPADKFPAGYIVELEAGVWLAPWRSDPGRTLVLNSAKLFHSVPAARRALTKARTYRPFPDAEIHGVSYAVES